MLGKLSFLPDLHFRIACLFCILVFFLVGVIENWSSWKLYFLLFFERGGTSMIMYFCGKHDLIFWS